MAYTVEDKEDFWGYMRDAAKDAFGTRSAAGDKAAFFALSDADIDSEIQYMSDAVGRAIREDEERQADAAVRFEALVAETIQSGAADRETALRWIIDAEGLTDDISFYGMGIVCHQFGLSYSYFGVKEMA